MIIETAADSRTVFTGPPPGCLGGGDRGRLPRGAARPPRSPSPAARDAFTSATSPGPSRFECTASTGRAVRHAEGLAAPGPDPAGRRSGTALPPYRDRPGQGGPHGPRRHARGGGLVAADAQRPAAAATPGSGVRHVRAALTGPAIDAAAADRDTPGRRADYPAQADRDRAERPDPGPGTTPRRPRRHRRHRRSRDARPHHRRFAELHADREQAEARLAAQGAVTPKAADAALLEELPLAGDILPGLPAELKSRLFDAFDLQILWNKPGRQAIVFAEITDATLNALPGILNPAQDGYDDTTELSPGKSAVVEDLFESPIAELELLWLRPGAK
jgi:hypothetical protein